MGHEDLRGCEEGGGSGFADTVDEPQPGDPADLPQGRGPLLVGGMLQANGEGGQDGLGAVVTGADHKRKAEPLVVGGIVATEGCPLVVREIEEPGGRLLGGRLGREVACRGRLADEVGMAADEVQLHRLGRRLDRRLHRGVEGLERAEGPLADDRFGHPGGVFVDRPADGAEDRRVAGVEVAEGAEHRHEPTPPRQPPERPSGGQATTLPKRPNIAPARPRGCQPMNVEPTPAKATSTEPAATIFVTGATGYVGGRLVPALLEAGYRVRCLVRQPRKLDARRWRQHPQLEVVAGDLDDAMALRQAMAGCRAAYYLVHSMVATGGTYAERDRELAFSFGTAAREAGLERIIYLGGLGEMGADLSEHLRSRRQVEETLAASGVAVTTFRAAMIIGAGSASFEILRYLVERLPIMVTPKWVTTECQPVAIADVLHWLTRCLEVPETAGKTLEIGGADVMPYRGLMNIMAEELGLPRRIILPVPVLTPRLSSLWINLVTPVSYRIAKPLAEGLKNRVVVTDDTTQRLMPHQAMGVREAIRRALVKIEQHDVETRWSVAGPVPGDPSWAGGTVFTDERSVEIDAEPPQVYAAVCRIGGGNGWYAGDMLWRLRGWMDTLVGGPGLRRGRRNPETVEFGETLDFWRVVDLNRDRSLSLRAEMKLPGEAQLDFRIEPIDEQADQPLTRLVMTARYRPRGLFGLLYWYAVVPLHELVFGGMLRGIRKTAEAMRRAAGGRRCHPAPERRCPRLRPGSPLAGDERCRLLRGPRRGQSLLRSTGETAARRWWAARQPGRRVALVRVGLCGAACAV